MLPLDEPRAPGPSKRVLSHHQEIGQPEAPRPAHWYSSEAQLCDFACPWAGFNGRESVLAGGAALRHVRRQQLPALDAHRDDIVFVVKAPANVNFAFEGPERLASRSRPA